MYETPSSTNSGTFLCCVFVGKFLYVAKSKREKDLRKESHNAALKANCFEKDLLFKEAVTAATAKGIDRETVYDRYLSESDELRIAAGKDAIFTPEFLAEMETLYNETLAEFFLKVSKLLQINPCCTPSTFRSS